MKKRMVYSIIKEIAHIIDGWDEERLEKELQKSEMTFAKFLPSADDWDKPEKYIINIKITNQRSMKKKNTLEKARSQLKKAEYATTPLAIKRKLKTKKQERKS